MFYCGFRKENNGRKSYSNRKEIEIVKVKGCSVKIDSSVSFTNH